MTTFYGGQPGHLAEHDRLAAFTTDTGIAALVSAGGPTEAALNATLGPGGTAGNAAASRVVASPESAALGTYDRIRNVYNLKPYHLRRTRAKIGTARAGGGYFKIAVCGHSMAAGVGATGGVSDFPTQLTNMLVNSGVPLAGTGLVPGYRGSAPLDSRWTWPAAWHAFGGSSNLMTNTTTNDAAVFASDKAGTIVSIVFFKTSTSSAYSVIIDGGTAVTVTPTGSNNTPYVYEVSGLGNTTHTVSVARATGASGAGYILGCEVRGAAGIRLYNGGIGGMMVSASADSGLYAQVPYASNGRNDNNGANFSWGADLLILGPIMANDAQAGTPTTAAAWQASLQTAINTAKGTSAGYPNPSDIVLCTDTPIATASSAMESYRAAIYALADTNDLPLIDMMDRWGVETSAASYGVMYDGTHPNGNGYADWARAIMTALAL